MSRTKHVKLSDLHKSLRKKGDFVVHCINHYNSDKNSSEVWWSGRSKDKITNRNYVSMSTGNNGCGGIRKGWQLLYTSYIDRLLNKNIGKPIKEVEKIFEDRLKYVNKKILTKVKLEDVIFKSIEEINDQLDILPDNMVFNHKLPYYVDNGLLEKYDSATKLSTKQTKYNNSCQLLIKNSDYYLFKDGVYLFDYYVSTSDGVFLLPVYSCDSNFPSDEFVEVPNSPKMYTGKRFTSAIFHSNYCDIVDSNNRKIDRYERKLEETNSCKIAIINNNKYYHKEEINEYENHIKVKELNEDYLFYDSKIKELKKNNINLKKKQRRRLIKSPLCLNIYYKISDLIKAKEKQNEQL